MKKWIGQTIVTMHRLMLDREKKIIPAAWRGEVVGERDNGLGQLTLSVVWELTGDVDTVFADQVEVFQK